VYLDLSSGMTTTKFLTHNGKNPFRIPPGDLCHKFLYICSFSLSRRCEVVPWNILQLSYFTSLPPHSHPHPSLDKIDVLRFEDRLGSIFEWKKKKKIFILRDKLYKLLITRLNWNQTRRCRYKIAMLRVASTWNCHVL